MLKLMTDRKRLGVVDTTHRRATTTSQDVMQTLQSGDWRYITPKYDILIADDLSFVSPGKISSQTRHTKTKNDVNIGGRAGILYRVGRRQMLLPAVRNYQFVQSGVFGDGGDDVMSRSYSIGDEISSSNYRPRYCDRCDADSPEQCVCEEDAAA